jgi:hypothetical protein
VPSGITARSEAVGIPPNLGQRGPAQGVVSRSRYLDVPSTRSLEDAGGDPGGVSSNTMRGPLGGPPTTKTRGANRGVRGTSSCDRSVYAALGRLALRGDRRCPMSGLSGTAIPSPVRLRNHRFLVLREPYLELYGETCGRRCFCLARDADALGAGGGLPVRRSAGCGRPAAGGRAGPPRRAATPCP